MSLTDREQKTTQTNIWTKAQGLYIQLYKIIQVKPKSNTLGKILHLEL